MREYPGFAVAVQDLLQCKFCISYMLSRKAHSPNYRGIWLNSLSQKNCISLRKPVCFVVLKLLHDIIQVLSIIFFGIYALIKPSLLHTLDKSVIFHYFNNGDFFYFDSPEQCFSRFLGHGSVYHVWCEITYI